MVKKNQNIVQHILQLNMLKKLGLSLAYFQDISLNVILSCTLCLIMEGVVCVYLDDILIFTKSIDEHRRITRLVLERLWAHKLFL